MATPRFCLEPGLFRRLSWVFLLAAGLCHAQQAPQGPDLSGEWRLNVSASDDAESALEARLEKERRRYAQRRRAEDSMRPPGIPPIDAEPPAPRGKPRPWQRQHHENLRKMLAISETLSIKQKGTSIDIVSAVDSRRIEAGSRTQVSMPEGELADSQVSWDRNGLVIERKVSRGPRVVERYRLLPKTDQLEYTMAWGGDTELSGIKLRRVFDRAPAAAPAAGPDAGPNQQ